MWLPAHFLLHEGNGPGESAGSSPGVIAPKPQPVRLVVYRRPLVRRKAPLVAEGFRGAPAWGPLQAPSAPRRRDKTIPRESTVNPPISSPSRNWIEGLDSEVFWQIQRGTVVNLRVISKVIRETDGRPRIRLRNCPEILAVSRSYSGLLRGM